MAVKFLVVNRCGNGSRPEKLRRDWSEGTSHAGSGIVVVDFSVAARARGRSHIAVIGTCMCVCWWAGARSDRVRARWVYSLGRCARSIEQSWHCCQDDYGGSKPTTGYRFIGQAPMKPSNCHA
jgi:hypothetical protein